MRQQGMLVGRRHDSASVARVAVIGLMLLFQAQAYAQDPSAPSIEKSGWIDVGADRIFYEEASEGSAMILIHDGLVHRETWDAQMSEFAQHFRVIRYDRRGYGASPAPTEPFSNVDDLHQLMENLNVDAACLVAMSAGGRLAIDFTLEHPDKVTSLVLVGAVVSGFPYTQHFYDRGGHLPEGLSFSEARAYYAADDPYTTYSENVAARARVIELVGRYPDHGRQGAFRTPPVQPALGRLSNISAHTLIIVGEFDIPDVHAHAGAINAGISGSERKIINAAGHLVPIEQPEEFNNAVLEFLNRARR